MRDEAHPIRTGSFVGAGTGGTSATIGRFIATAGMPPVLCVVDPENSAFFPSYAQGRRDLVTGMSSRIEGIGRPRVEPSFLPDVVDHMVVCPMRRRSPRRGMSAACWADGSGRRRGPIFGGVRPAGRDDRRIDAAGQW